MEKELLIKLRKLVEDIQNLECKDLKTIEEYLKSRNISGDIIDCICADICKIILLENANKERYKEIFEFYNSMLNVYKQFASELKLNSSLEISNLYTYLLWNGYFSYKKEHTYDARIKSRSTLSGISLKNIQNCSNNLGLEFIDVILGRGVCFNYASVLTEFLNVCGKDSFLLCCKCPTKKTNCIYMPDIKRNIIKPGIGITIFSKFFEFIASKVGFTLANHAINVIVDSDKTYAFDSTQIKALNFKEDGTLDSLTTGQTFIPSSVESFFANYDLSASRILNLEEFYKNPSVLLIDDYIITFEEVMEKLNDPTVKKVLDDVYRKDVFPILSKILDENNKAKQKVKTKLI